MTTSKSPKAIATWAYTIAQHSLPAYSCSVSPQKYTQHQLFTLLVLQQFFTTDYRGIVAIVEDFTDIREILGLSQVPHYTTLQKAAKRLLHAKSIQ